MGILEESHELRVSHHTSTTPFFPAVFLHVLIRVRRLQKEEPSFGYALAGGISR
jgi:hypothetical protein